MQDRQVLQKPVIPTFDITDFLSFQQQNISCELNAVFFILPSVKKRRQARYRVQEAVCIQKSAVHGLLL